MAEALNLWSGWPRMVEVGGNALLFYVLIVVMVRLVGKRTTSELNNFDWIMPEDEWESLSLSYTSGTTGRPKHRRVSVGDGDTGASTV